MVYLLVVVDFFRVTVLQKEKENAKLLIVNEAETIKMLIEDVKLRTTESSELFEKTKVDVEEMRQTRDDIAGKVSVIQSELDTYVLSDPTELKTIKGTFIRGIILNLKRITS